jgi:hypothetical protein
MTFYPPKPQVTPTSAAAPASARTLIFEAGTVESLRELGVVLGSIRKRLVAEGYTFDNGRIYKKYEDCQ